MGTLIMYNLHRLFGNSALWWFVGIAAIIIIINEIKDRK